MIGFLAVLALTCMSCRDANPLGPGLPSPSGGARMFEEVQCTVTVQTGEMNCRDGQSGGAPGGASRAVYGQTQVRLRSSNVLYDTTTLTFGWDLKLYNLLGEPLGTPDGTTISGAKVFFDTSPYATSYVAPYDTGTITVRNADGMQNFTKPRQPYFLYPQIVQPGDSTPFRRWELRVPRSVNTFSMTFRVFTATPSEPKVPVVPPDSIPWAVLEEVSDSTKWVWNDPRETGPFPRNYIIVHFRSGATQEERQAALDVIGGWTAGGVRIANGGFYVVKIADNGTADPLFTALDRLHSLPQVDFASTYLIGAGPQWKRPNDGPGWRRNDWQLDPGAADGDNWALEAIGAPLAWGCESGVDSTLVGIVDNGEHGDVVRAIIGERGNDSVGTTGVMWRSSAQVYDYFTPRGSAQTQVLGQMKAIAQAAQEGRAAVNLSLGINFVDELGHSPSMSSATDRRKAQLFADVLYRTLTDMEEGNLKTLLVISAGNDRSDAFFSGYPIVADSPRVRDRVIVVAA
ncbi:MAG TPA: S8 family serine peptidase, partial [Longimicrobium sp.]